MRLARKPTPSSDPSRDPRQLTRVDSGKAGVRFGSSQQAPSRRAAQDTWGRRSPTGMRSGRRTSRLRSQHRPGISVATRWVLEVSASTIRTMKAKDAARQISNDHASGAPASHDFDADLTFPVQIAEILSKTNQTIDFAALDFGPLPERDRDRDRWGDELVAIASSSAFPLALRRAALTGFADPGEEGWEDKELKAVTAILKDPTVSPRARIELAEAYAAFSDPLGEIRNELFTTVVRDPELDLETRAKVATSIRPSGWYKSSMEAAEGARSDLFDWIVERSLFETLSIGTRIAVDAAISSAPGVLDLARVATEFSKFAARAADVLSDLSNRSSLDPETQQLAYRLWHGLVAPVADKERRQHVFISYVTEDAGTVARLERDLRALGVNGWLDKNHLRPGQRWRDQLRQAIREGAAFIAAFSSASESRERSYMREELNIAVEELRKRPRNRAWFIPVLLSPVILPELNIGPGEYLSDIQYVSLDEDWDRKIVTLAETILEIIEP